MAFLGNFRANRVLEQLAESDAPPGPATDKAVASLRALGPAVIDPVLVALPNATRPVQGALIEVLAGVANNKTLPVFLKALADIGPRVAPSIVQALKQSEDLTPTAVIEALRTPGMPKPPLLEIIRTHRKRVQPRDLLNAAMTVEGNDKAALYRIIGDIATPALVPELINRLESRDTVGRVHLIHILSRFDVPEVGVALQRVLDDKSKHVRSAALAALAKSAAMINVKKVCALLLDPEIEVQNHAVDVLVRARDPQTVEHLIPILKDENEFARRSAVEVLNEVGDANSIKHLLNAIKDSDWWVRSRAGDALGKIGGQKVIKAVLQLARDEDPELRRTAIEILNQTKDPHAVSYLIEATKDADWWVQERAVDALAAIGDKRALPRLLDMLGSADERLLPVVIRGVAAMGETQGFDHLLPLLKRPERAIRLEVIQQLGKVTDERLAAHVKGQLSALAGTGDQAIVQAVDGALKEISARFEQLPAAGESDESPRTMMMSESDLQQAIRRVEPEQAVSRLDISTLKAGDIIEGRYRFVQRIGKGAFGTVLLMEDTVVEEQLVLKFLNPSVAEDEEIMKRFVHELRFSRKITHPNVIRIYDFLEIRGNYAISMEYFASHTLGSEIVDDKPMAKDRAVRFGMDMCTGMAVAHEAGIVHRDLKPANVLINDAGELKIVDFGVAAAHREGDTQLTKTGFVIGSPKYMAPEQILGRQVDERADIYAVGVILYELLTGAPPYTKGDHMSIMYQHVQGKAPSPSELNPTLPAGLGDVVLKAMAVDKGKRYQSMNELKAALAAFA